MFWNWKRCTFAGGRCICLLRASLSKWGIFWYFLYFRSSGNIIDWSFLSMWFISWVVFYWKKMHMSPRLVPGICFDKTSRDTQTVSHLQYWGALVLTDFHRTKRTSSLSYWVCQKRYPKINWWIIIIIFYWWIINWQQKHIIPWSLYHYHPLSRSVSVRKRLGPGSGPGSL